MYESKRLEMVKSQIEARGIKDKKVLSAMKKVPRHLLMPENVWHLAYTDRAVPIGEEQTISQPYIVAAMTALLRLKGNERVLEIGTGSGYQAAVLAEIVPEVYTIEIVKALGQRAKKNLKKLGYKNISVRIGDGFKGWKEHAPYDAIIITCAVPEVPVPLLKQLKDGGRIVVPLGEDLTYQTLSVVEKKKGKLIYKNVMGVVFVPMTGKNAEKLWSK